MEKKTGPLKVLVVALDNLGDAVMASSVLPPLRRKYPSAKIGLWVKNYTASLFEGHSMVDRLHGCDPFWDRSPGRGKGTMADFRRTMEDIQKEKYRVALVV